ncbi:MAG: hypothetical protein GY929_20155, partial [Actinomycetia bacterium]|nr:hypothetical protein [Actinomycetes bacterium]
LGGLLLQKGKDLIQGLIDGIKGLLGSAGSGLLGLVFGIPAALVAAFASIGPGTLLSKGADLIQGLISGIASKIPGLTSAIGAAQTAIGAISGGGSTMGSFATGSLGGSKGWSKNTSGAKTSSGRVYASAGIVPGRIGELVPILAHGGEELRPLGSTPSHTDTTGATVFAPVINLHGPTTMADANRVVEALVAY